MTCVAAVIHPVKGNNHVWMCGDSAVTGESDIEVRQESKVFYCGSFLMGCAGSVRVHNLLQYRFQPPALETNIKNYLVGPFTDTLRALLKDNGVARKSDEQEWAWTELLIAYQGTLYVMQSDYQIGQVGDFYAIGSGGPIAMGALYATRGQRPMKRLTLALEAAQEYCNSVRGPFTWLKA